LLSFSSEKIQSPVKDRVNNSVIEAFVKDLNNETRITGAARMNEDVMRLQKRVKEKLAELRDYFDGDNSEKGEEKSNIRVVDLANEIPDIRLG
jgi:hypothetical protein